MGFAVTGIERLLEGGGIGMALYRPQGSPANKIRFKVYHRDTAVPLSDVLPLFEHMGFRVMDEIPHDVVLGPGPDQGRKVVIHDFGLESGDGSNVNLEAINDNLKDAFGRVWHGETESDGLNALVSGGGLA